MNYNHPDRDSSTISIRLMCAIVFLVFSFCWLYYFQADVIAMAQHVLSKGITHYVRWIGAVLITLVLFLLQAIIFAICRLEKRTHALTYLPSMFVLAQLSDINISSDQDLSIGLSWIAIILITVVWILCVVYARLMQNIEDGPYHFFSAPMWINLLEMCIMMAGVAMFSNTNAVLHYRMQAENCLMQGDYQGALEAGEKSLESDENLTMLRMYALSREGELPERLFKYPVTATSEQMLPTDSLSQLLLYPADSLYRYLGGRPAKRMTPNRYLTLLQKRDSVPQQKITDYLLCGYLIDRQIDRFAQEIGHYYKLNDSLPRHYREALILYTHLRSHPVCVYHHSAMDEDFHNMQELEKRYSKYMERKGKVEEQYRGTYWYYYKYEKQ